MPDSHQNTQKFTLTGNANTPFKQVMTGGWPRRGHWGELNGSWALVWLIKVWQLVWKWVW